MYSALCELSALLDLLATDEESLVVVSEQQLDDALRDANIRALGEIARVKNAWKEIRQRSGE
jgi:hypothetical protein